MAAGQDLRIHSAIEQGFFQQIRFLVDQGYDVNAKDHKGRTPLILCSAISDDIWSVGLARLLLENGARISKYDKDGYNALHHACINQREKLVEVYLAALDCDVNSKSKEGNTSLHYAALLGNLNLIKSLASLVVKYKMKLDPKNKKGLTPLHCAWKSNHVDCGDMLVDYGADVTIKDVDNKTASVLREEAIERLELMKSLSKAKNGHRELKKIKKCSTLNRPKTSEARIREAKECDLRNTPEYVFNVSAIDYFQQKVIKDIMNQSQQAKSNHWKDQLMMLWKCYEIQNSDAFRKPATPVSNSQTPSQGRRTSSLSSGMPSLNRRSSRVSIKSRTGSITSINDSGSRRQSVVGRRSGMPPLVRAQSRASFTVPEF